MADAADATRGMQFARDLREIRRANGISVDDIHNESKIPIGLIESFEENGLFDHTMFNRVYLRSFVRTYADVVGIPTDEALVSLEAALDGTYNRELAVNHLDLDPAPVAKTSEPDEDEDAVVPEPVPADSTESRPDPEEGMTPVPGPVEAEAQVERGVPEFQKSTSTPVPPAAEVQPEWTQQSPPPGTRLEQRRESARSSGTWAYVLGTVVLLAAVVWGVTRMTGGVEEPDVEATVTAVDTTEDVRSVATPAAPEPVILGDTMRVTVASADSQLVQDIKVTVDDDVRRPYWLERGERRTFPATNQVVIEQQLDVIDLFVEGRAYPTSRVDDQGRIVITRDVVQQFLSESQ